MTSRTAAFRSPTGSARSDLPPGQHLRPALPVMSFGTVPAPVGADWSLRIVTQSGDVHRWSAKRLRALPLRPVVADVHCVAGWSRTGTTWTGCSLDRLLEGVETSARYAVLTGRDGYRTRVGLHELRDVQAWLVLFDAEAHELAPEHGAPVRLLVPHLYLWHSVKWLDEVRLTDDGDRGFWEAVGRDPGADPWREQRWTTA